MEIQFKKVHTSKDIIISCITMIAGIGLYFLSKSAGITVALCGIAMLYFYKSGYKKDGDTILLQKKTVELSTQCRANVLDFLNGKTDNPVLISGNVGGTILLEVWYNLQKPIAYARLSDYKDATFQPTTDIIQLQENKINSLIKQL